MKSQDRHISQRFDTVNPLGISLVRMNYEVNISKIGTRLVHGENKIVLVLLLIVSGGPLFNEID